MGTLAGIALRLREFGNGSLLVRNANERNWDLLQNLGLNNEFDDVFDLLLKGNICARLSERSKLPAVLSGEQDNFGTNRPVTSTPFTFGAGKTKVDPGQEPAFQPKMHNPRGRECSISACSLE